MYTWSGFQRFQVNPGRRPLHRPPPAPEKIFSPGRFQLTNSCHIAQLALYHHQKTNT